MGVAIKCILEQDVPGAHQMEGKSLAMAYCGDPGREDADGVTSIDVHGDVIAIDFGGSKPPSPPLTTESLFRPLDQFIAGDGSIEWHDPADALTVIKSILSKLRAGATVGLAPDFEFGDEEDLTEGVLYDLEELEQILGVAQRAGNRFYLAFDV